MVREKGATAETVGQGLNEGQSEDEFIISGCGAKTARKHYLPAFSDSLQHGRYDED